MSDVIIKSEREDDVDSNGSLCELTKLLQEVKKEKQKSLSDEEETQVENDKGEALPESFFDDLFRDEIEACPDDATTEADIQKLQEIIAKRKRILNEDLELPGDGEQDNPQSKNPEADCRKRKENRQNDDNETNESQSKRARQTIDAPQDRSESTSFDTPLNDDTSNQQPPSPASGCAPPAEQSTSTDPEIELENLLKSEDYNSDNEDPPGRSMNNMQSMYTFPNAMPMVPAMYNPTTNQMMPNMPAGGFPMMCNMGGFPAGFYPQNMMNMQMQMMGYGLPQMNVPPGSSNDTEVQCLPVVSSNSGLPKIPFKKIKLEKGEKTVAPAEDPKKKVIDACIKLLESMNVSESTGKFVYTSTVTKQNNVRSPNSVLQRITNVSYNFQSIGPKQNLQDWGLKGIPNGNAEIAKKISMSADKYFSKISENANTTARKLIKQEVTKADKNRREQEEMEVEEPTLSTYFKNSMTQTEPLVCRECVVRKRKVGHNIAVQTSVSTGSIGSQTDPEVRFNEQLTAGLSDNQLKAMYEFSLLIREPPKNTSVELVRLREQLMNMYNLSQRQHKLYVPFIDASSLHPVMAQSLARDPRIDNRPTSDPRSFAQTGAQNHMMHHPPVQTPQQFNPNFSQQGNHQIPFAQYPGRMRNDNGYAQGRPQEQAMQIPNQQLNMGHPGFTSRNPGHQMPELESNEFAQHDGRKKYGRGGLRR